jgi:transcriptional regulator with XRE-family HTH domain
MPASLKAIRLKRGRTLVQVAEAIGTDAGNLSRIERGRQKASTAMAAKLARYYAGEITELEILYPERMPDSGPRSR